MQWGEISNQAATMMQPVGGMGVIGQTFGRKLVRRRSPTRRRSRRSAATDAGARVEWRDRRQRRRPRRRRKRHRGHLHPAAADAAARVAHDRFRARATKSGHRRGATTCQAGKVGLPERERRFWEDRFRPSTAASPGPAARPPRSGIRARDRPTEGHPGGRLSVVGGRRPPIRRQGARSAAPRHPRRRRGAAPAAARSWARASASPGPRFRSTGAPGRNGPRRRAPRTISACSRATGRSCSRASTCPTSTAGRKGPCAPPTPR